MQAVIVRRSFHVLVYLIIYVGLSTKGYFLPKLKRERLSSFLDLKLMIAPDQIIPLNVT